ncbi:hypothetical protein ABEB36_000472 [Hypothenemus hampei]
MIEQWKQEKNLGFLGVPHFIASGSCFKNHEKYRFLIMPKYDRDLEAILQVRKVFNLKTVLVIATQIINTLEYIHSKGYVHSDIKASNIMIGHQAPLNRKSTRVKQVVKRFAPLYVKKGKPIIRASSRNLRHLTKKYVDDIPFLEEMLKEFEQNKSDILNRDFDGNKGFNGDLIYLLDYGLASKFLLSDGTHREFSVDERRAHAGTILFCSRDAHKGIVSRRSDLESLAYNIIYWLTGTLPWIDHIQELEIVEKMKGRCFNNIKAFLQLCFQDPPMFLLEVFEYLNKLQLKDPPNYDFFRILFKNTIREYGYPDDLKLDLNNLEGWGQKPKTKTNKKHQIVQHSFLWCSPLRPLSSNIIFKRPKLRKKSNNKMALNSMMNWSKILIDPETILKQATHNKFTDEDKATSILDIDLDSLNPTPQMRQIYFKACQRQEKSNSDHNSQLSAIEGYTKEMLRIHNKIVENSKFNANTTSRSTRKRKSPRIDSFRTKISRKESILKMK